MQALNSTSRQRTLTRRHLHVSTRTNIPVTVIAGHLPPKIIGQRGGHFTRGGSRISYPSAYAKRGWSNMVYRRSTQRIYVGDRWLAQAEQVADETLHFAPNGRVSFDAEGKFRCG